MRLRRLLLGCAVGAAVAAVVLVPQQALANGCLTDPGVWVPGSGGSPGTYNISTPDQLRTLYQGSCDMTATIRIANDIDLTGTGPFLPIGSAANLDPFRGMFDGGGHTITGLEIASPSQNGFGLLGATNGATIRDIRGIGTVVGKASGAGSENGALLVGSATETSIINAHVEGSVSTARGAGGLVGEMTRGSIRDATASVEVTSPGVAGGLVAWAYPGGAVGVAITNARTTGSVTSSGAGMFAGGIAGSLAGVSVVRSSSSATVTGYFAGGIAGQAQSNDIPGTAISDSYSTGAVVATAGSAGAIGGILGITCPELPIDIVRNYFAGTLAPAGTATSGGIVGGSAACTSSIGPLATTQGNLWNADTTGAAGAGGTVGVGKTTAQMKEIGTYTALGWSIVNGWEPAGTSTWGICSQVNDGYPFLQGQTASTACKAPAEAPAGSSPATAAALTATLLPSRRRVVSGQRMRIGIRAANTGGTAAESVTSCIRLPSNMVITSAAGAVRSGRTACFRLGTVAAGAQATKALTVRVVSVRRIKVTVTGSARATGVARVQAASKAVVITPRAVRARVTG